MNQIKEQIMPNRQDFYVATTVQWSEKMLRESILPTPKSEGLTVVFRKVAIGQLGSYGCDTYMSPLIA